MGKKQGNKPVAGSSRPGVGAGQLRRHEKKMTNSRPKNLDSQEIPFKLREIMKSRMDMNKPRKKKKRMSAPKQGPHNEELQTDIQVPKFKRRKRESVGAYLHRMNQETQHVIFLSKNQLDRLPEQDLDDKGEVINEEVTKEEGTKKKSQKKNAFEQRRLNKVLKKKEEKKETRLEQDMFKDTVMFGEVAMQPPSLTVKPRKSVAVTKPGEKKLLLKKLFDKGGSPSHAPAMSLARKKLLEDERERVIQAYRDLKKKRTEQATDMKLSKPHHT
ncbi:coiled-coil domain-containing protein 137 [Pseudophryne corroboree]|uniref:coiled-coil domain-containing protein 137 n=1 Tax=Pseudophryne corroboree TaxID=495146 RepID=UPI003081AE55